MKLFFFQECSISNHVKQRLKPQEFALLDEILNGKNASCSQQLNQKNAELSSVINKNLLNDVLSGNLGTFSNTKIEKTEKAAESNEVDGSQSFTKLDIESKNLHPGAFNTVSHTGSEKNKKPAKSNEVDGLSSGTNHVQFSNQEVLDATSRKDSIRKGDESPAISRPESQVQFHSSAQIQSPISEPDEHEFAGHGPATTSDATQINANDEPRVTPVIDTPPAIQEPLVPPGSADPAVSRGASSYGSQVDPAHPLTHGLTQRGAPPLAHSLPRSSLSPTRQCAADPAVFTGSP